MSHSGDGLTMARIAQQKHDHRQACGAGRMFNQRALLWTGEKSGLSGARSLAPHGGCG